MSNPFQIVQVTTAQQAEQMADFFKKVWGSDEDVVPFDLALALIHVGAYAHLAFANDELVAASFGVRGVLGDQQILHSHVTASVRAGAGFELKRHQRSWAHDAGIAAITWTFDPLVRRNCVFNFVKLGATAIEYLPNFYGEMRDEINRGDQSDRLLAYWLTDPESADKGAETDASSEEVLVTLPEDIEALRKVDLGEALRWRSVVREQLEPKLSAGYQVSGMTADRTALILTKR